MEELKTLNSLALNNGDMISGYRVKRIVPLKENRIVFHELEHLSTGARHIHIAKDDKENTFGVAFKTVPSDSTGVAHILEHTVLCGSKNFPVRDPFFSMLKRSLSTFMNAFTSSDWTMYPFSTQNKKDFYNLMDVYLDAAFFPNIDELSFKQEGHRLEIEKGAAGDSEDGLELVFKGVVYNEMKGAMSSADQVMARSITNALYPLTTYSFNSGGDPAVIPELTYEQLIAFHRRHYHPSNAYFYTYGDLPLKDHLLFIEEKILRHFNRIDPNTNVPAHPRWSAPKKVSYAYPFDAKEAAQKKFQCCLAWLTADIQESFETLVLVILEKVLLGNSASPLRKALIDSGLGTALCDGTGFDADNRDTLFVCGLKDIEESCVPKVEAIIFDVLKGLVKTGIDEKLIASAIHQIEFERKEITNTPFPYGIKLLLTVCGSWFHEGDPVKNLQFDADLDRLRKALSEGPFLEEKITHYFLNNLHRVLLTLVPDPQKEKKDNSEIKKRLRQIKARLTPEDILKINADAEALVKLQESAEDLSALPTLALEDIPPDVQVVTESTAYPDAPALCYEQATSGIFYFSLVAGTGDLPERLIPYVPFFCSAFSRMGTKIHDYTEIAQLVDAYTGGIGMSSIVRTSFEKTVQCQPYVSFSGKCLVRNLDKMNELIEELLTQFDFSNLTRLQNLLFEYRAGMESSIVNNGHRYAISLASRNFSVSATLSEIWSGVHQLQTVKALTADLSNDKLKELSISLTQIGQAILKKNNIKIALIGEENTVPRAIDATSSILQAIEGGTSPASILSESFPTSKLSVTGEIPWEGWSTATAVSFVAKSFMTVRMDHEDAPRLSVLSKMLKSLFLHREIREKGGAYGGFSAYNPEDGLFCLASYRDPHIYSTINVFDAAASFIKSGKYTDEDIKEAILQLASEIDKPDTPATAARKAFHRKIVSLSDEARRKYKEEILATTKKQVMMVAEKYFGPENAKHAVAVISSEEKLKAANEKLKDNPLRLFRI